MDNQKKASGALFFDTKKFVKAFLVSIVFTIAATIVLAGLFLKGNNLENLLYYARVPMSDGSTQAIKNCVEFCVPTAISIFVLTNILSFIILINKST
ncbi:MAG: hypothetical protein IKA95_06005, partial [Clostridia bacterium]|nr:hypothetical protein [Clostridia bacterium]